MSTRSPRARCRGRCRGTGRDDAGAPVAVNVSLGMNAGAHDGSSLLELAFDPIPPALLARADEVFE
jgi:hypothetical protein